MAPGRAVRNERRKHSCVAFVCAVVLASESLAAQTSGAIAGRVHDSTSSLSIAGALISVDGGR